MFCDSTEKNFNMQILYLWKIFGQSTGYQEYCSTINEI